jgi:hypothetical protein
MSTEGVTKEVTGALLRQKKIWLVRAEKILGLPSSLFLVVTAPLNLIETNHPLPHDSVLLNQKLHWMPWIGHVSIERHDIINNDTAGRHQTFPQLSYVEHVVHTRQGWRQPQTYATAPSLVKTGNRQMYHGASLPLILNHLTPHVGETQRYT